MGLKGGGAVLQQGDVLVVDGGQQGLDGLCLGQTGVSSKSHSQLMGAMVMSKAPPLAWHTSRDVRSTFQVRWSISQKIRAGGLVQLLYIAALHPPRDQVLQFGYGGVGGLGSPLFVSAVYGFACT